MGASLSIVSVHTKDFLLSLEQGENKQVFNPDSKPQTCKFLLKDSSSPCPNEAVKLYHGGRLVMQIWEHDYRINFRVADKDFKSPKVSAGGNSTYCLVVDAEGHLEFVDCGSSGWKFSVADLNLRDYDPECKQHPPVTVHLGPLSGQTNLDAAVQQVEQAAQADLKDKKVRILVLGPSGSGKSSLISMVFPYLRSPPKSGMGAPVTKFEDIEKAWTDDEGKMPILMHDSQGLELANFHVLQKLKTWVNEKATQEDPADRLHVVWYTLPLAGGIRCQDADVELMRFIAAQNIPLFVVLTFADKATAGGEDALRKTLEEKVSGVPKGIFTTSTISPLRKQAKECRECRSDEILFHPKTNKWICECKHAWQEDFEFKHELEQLVDATFESFTHEWLRTAFAKAQTVSFRPKIKQSIAAIVASVISSAAIGANPIPFSDALLLIPLEYGLINLLAYIWDIRLSLKSLLGLGLTQILFSQTIAVGLVSMLKMALGPGTAAGGAINGTMAAILTLTIGIVYTAGFSHAKKKGWVALSDKQLLENLATVINVKKFESVRATVSGMFTLGMSSAAISEVVEGQVAPNEQGPPPITMKDEVVGPSSENL